MTQTVHTEQQKPSAPVFVWAKIYNCVYRFGLGVDSLTPGAVSATFTPNVDTHM